MAGWVDSIRSRVRGLMQRDQEQIIVRAATGATASTLPSSSYDLLQSYGYDLIADYLRVEQDLMSRYIDYEGMDDYPESSAALNIYAEDATQPDTPSNRQVWVESPDYDIQTLLNDFLHRTLRIQDDLKSMARSLCKMGNDSEEIIVGEQGVIGINHLPAHTMRRIEGPRGELYGFVQDFKRRQGYSPREFQEILARRLNRMADQQGMAAPNLYTGPVRSDDLDDAIAFENWQVAHMRLRTKHRKSIYGYSIFEPARWIWKRLVLLEDAALVYRLQRAAERYAFYVDTGTLPPNEALKLLNFVRHQFKKKKFVNPVTGELDLKFNALAQDEDFFIPAPEGRESTRIDVLSSPSWQHMEDIEYFLNKMFSALLVPKAYLSQDEGISRQILSSEDVRFARTIMGVQREMKHGIEKICRVHLAAIGIPPDVVDFDVRFTVPSSIFELAQIEVRNARADLADRMRAQVSHRWVLENVFDMTEDEIKTIFSERMSDARREGRQQGVMEKMIQNATMGAEGGFPGGGAPGGAPPRPGAPPAGSPGASAPPEQLRQWRELRESRIVGLSRPRLIRHYRGGMSERELLEGDRKAERNIGGQVEALMRGQSQQARQLKEVRGLLTDLRSVMAKR